MMCTKPSARRWRARPAPLLLLTLCGFLALLSAGCAQQAPVLQPAKIAPPPADLAAPCEAGPDYPDADMALGDLLDLVAQREAAAAVCRARHDALVKAWPQ